MKKILLLTVGALLVIGLVGVGTFAISQDVEAGTAEPKPFFVFSDLVISPTDAGIGQIVTISATVTNTDDAAASSFELGLKIDGVVEAINGVVALDIGDSEKVTFTISKDVAGTYAVVVGGLTGSFTVWEVLPTPTTTTPTTTTPAPDDQEPLNWALIGGIIAAVVVVVLVFFLVRRKAA